MSIKLQDDRKQVLVLTSTFPRWEGDHEPPFVFELSKRLGQRFKITVLAPHAPGAKQSEIMDGMEVHRFRYFPERWQRLAYDGGILSNLKKNCLNYFVVPFFVLSETISVVLLLRKTKVDVIHAHWLIPQGMVALIARALTYRKPLIVCTSHGGDLFGLPGGVFSWLKKQVLTRTDKLTVVSQAMRDFASSLVGRQDIDVIPMGVDLIQRFTPPQEGGVNRDKLLFVGRLVEKKGVHYLIQAMPEILNHYPRIRLLIAGDGPDRVELQELALAMGVASQIQFLGTVKNTALRELYGQASIFIAPSIVASGGDQEGLGLVFVEALGCECAVIASDLAAIRDVVVDGVTGHICRQKDSVDLAGKVVALLNDSGLRQALGRAGRQHVLGRFDWRIVGDRYIQLIDDLAARP